MEMLNPLPEGSMNKIKLLLILMAVAILVGCLSASSGAAVITAASAGNGKFELRAIDFDGVSGLDITLNYDTASLSNPRILEGGLISGSMIESNTRTPGRIKIAVITTKKISGSGLIASLVFSRSGNLQGRITSMKASAFALDGTPKEVKVQILNAGDSDGKRSSATHK
jgi:hypothetical protein